MSDGAPLDGYVGNLSEAQAAREEKRWSEATTDWGPPEEWEKGPDGSYRLPDRFAFDARLVNPQPVVVLHGDVTRMLEHTAGGLSASLNRRGFEFPADLRAAIIAAGPPCGYVFECLAKATLLGAHFAATGELLTGQALTKAATQPGGGFRGHQLSTLFERLQAAHPECAGELGVVLADQFTRAAVETIDAFVARLRYRWQDEARGETGIADDFDMITFALHTTYVRASGCLAAEQPPTTEEAMGSLDGCLTSFAEALINVYFALTAALWHATRPLPYFPSDTLLAQAAKAFPDEARLLLGVTLEPAPPGWQMRALAGGGTWGHFGSEPATDQGEL